MFKERLQFLRQLAILLDIALLAGSFLAATSIRSYLLTVVFLEKRLPPGIYNSLLNLFYREKPAVSPTGFGVNVVLLLLSVFIWSLWLNLQGAYDPRKFAIPKVEPKLILKASLYSLFSLILLHFLFRLAFFPRSLIGLFFAIGTVLLLLERVAFCRIAERMKKGEPERSVLVVGTGPLAHQFVHSLNSHNENSVRIIGFLDRPENLHNPPVQAELLGTPEDLPRILHSYPIDDVVFAVPVGELEHLKNELALCEQEGVQVHVLSDFFQTMVAKLRTDEIYGIPILTFSSVPDKPWQMLIKRVLDVAISATALVVLAPIFAGIAIAIKLTSPGPVFYRWRVVGRNKKPFTSYKFRTMVQDADRIKQELLDRNIMRGPVFKLKDDPRVTKVGRWLRKFSLDELPQLWSVLKGDMSLVGPRPPLVDEIDKFESWHRRKLSVRPGITCLWQISGRNEIRDFDEWVKMDLEYIDNWSLWLDIKILLKTIPVVLSGRGAY